VSVTACIRDYCISGIRTDILSRTDPDSPRVRKMMTGYKLHEFGYDETWSDVAIYTRKSKAAPIPREDGTFQDLPLGDD
jgi:hypothetical protein